MQGTQVYILKYIYRFMVALIANTCSFDAYTSEIDTDVMIYRLISYLYITSYGSYCDIICCITFRLFYVTEIVCVCLIVC